MGFLGEDGEERYLSYPKMAKSEIIVCRNIVISSIIKEALK
jgi:hypothetical protein